MRSIAGIGCLLAATVAASWATAQEPPHRNAENPEAVAEVLAGARSEANAAWWGFDSEDATEALQAALDSGAARLTIPYMGEPWNVRPLRLAGDQELFLEPGVVLLAREGEFMGRGDSLLTASGVRNLTIRGYGATLRMRKRDYMAPPYEAAEWRMGLSIRGGANILVEGLRIESSGGDGIYIDGDGDVRYSTDITIRDVVCFDNHRQGISVISAENLLIENSVFANTWGTAPAAGLDLEPDSKDQRLVNIVVRNCLFENNEGHEVLVYPKNLKAEFAPDISVRFENCIMRKTLVDGRPAGVREGIGRDDRRHGWAGISVAAVTDEGPGGYIEFVNCTVENTGKESVRVFDHAVGKTELRLINCHFRNPWLTEHPDHWYVRVPIHLHARRLGVAGTLGGIVFDDCHVYDTVSRPPVLLDQRNSHVGLQSVKGLIVYHGPGEPELELGNRLTDVTLRLVHADTGAEPARRPDADAE